ncbi:MAG: hypothetical protein R3292_09180 [Alcanivorax sp.]|nr:hypothetical protein [Alcanivorax sp.]
MKKWIIGTLTAAALIATVPAQAKPPWAGNNDKHADSRHEQREHSERDQGDYRDHERLRQYRYSREERHALDHYGNHRPDLSSLPPGLQKKVARGGALPPGWQKKVQVGQRLPDDIYHAGYRLPANDDIRHIQGVTDMVIDNEVVRVLDATQTIVDVFGLNR